MHYARAAYAFSAGIKCQHCMVTVTAVQCGHLIPALNAGAIRTKYTTARPIAIQFYMHGCMDNLTIERGFDSQAKWVIDVLGLFSDMLSTFVFTTSH